MCKICAGTTGCCVYLGRNARAGGEAASKVGNLDHFDEEVMENEARQMVEIQIMKSKGMRKTLIKEDSLGFRSANIPSLFVNHLTEVIDEAARV